MSRLYDRVLARGCRPLTGLDIHLHWSGEDTRESVRLAIREETGRDPTDAEIDALDRKVRTGSAKTVSSLVFDIGEAVGAHVVSVEEVAAYWQSLPQPDVLDLVETVAPPFDRMFIEAQGQPNHLNFRAWGLLLDAGQNESGWSVSGVLIGEWTKGEPTGPISRLTASLDRDGKLSPSSETGRMGVFAEVPDIAQQRLRQLNIPPEQLAEQILAAEREDADLASSLADYLGPAFFSISLMHCKNVRERAIDPPERLSRRHARRYGRPLTRYHVLAIEPMRRILDTEGEARTKGLGHALHICRGHFKTYTEEAPLLGRHVGTYWWPAHVRGKAEEGIIEKDYRMRLDTGDLGQTYREADEAATVAPTKDLAEPDNPDARGRGLRAHNVTQNALAEALRQAGFVPRSPKRGEADYDLAWEDSDVVWVAEVKSITNATEERQMRIAIGQVLRYRQKLARDGQEVRALIAIERAPSDESWLALCEQEQIALVWPDVMADALGTSGGATS